MCNKMKKKKKAIPKCKFHLKWCGLHRNQNVTIKMKGKHPNRFKMVEFEHEPEC